MKNKPKRGFPDFEINLDELLLSNGLISDYMYWKELQERKLFLSEAVGVDTVGEIVKQILQYNADDKEVPVEERKPVLLYITSPGGDVDAGFELIDVILASKTPVYTINLGYWYSMALFIGMAGKKRFASVNSKYLMHDGSNFVYNSSAKARDQMKFTEEVEKRLRDYVLSTSRILPEEYDNKLRVEWYMFADEAKEKGIIDYIVGVDCGIDEIV